MQAFTSKILVLFQKLIRALFQSAHSPELNIFWYGLQGLVLILPWNSIVTVIVTLIYMGLFGLYCGLKGYGWQRIDTVINRGWLGLAGWLVITTLTAFDPIVATTGIWNFLPFFLWFAIASTIVQTSAQLHQLAWLWVLSSLPVSVFGILQAVINRPDWTLPQLFGSYIITLGLSPDRRVASLFGHFNEAAMYLLLILPVAYYLVLHRSSGKTKRLVAGIALVLGIITLLLLGSRNAWALAAIGLVVLSIYYRHWWLVGGISASGALVSWGVWGQKLGIGGEFIRNFLPQGLVNRLASAIDPSLNDYASTAYRLDAWQFALHLIQMRPIQGWGMRSFAFIANAFGYDLHGLPHEHNFYLTLAVGAGIPALLGFLVLLFSILWQSLRAKLPASTHELIFVMVVAIALFYLSGLLDVVFYEPRVNMLSWLILASMYGLSRHFPLPAMALEEENLKDKL